jgi:LSD1 subclass zinc finger protein
MAATILFCLRGNDPHQTFIWIPFCDFSDDVALSKALQANDYVSKIHLELMDLPSNSNWDSLRHVLATRENLHEVTLRDTFSVPAERVAPFLRAIQQNPSIHTVTLRSLQLPELGAYLHSATSITTLKIQGCRMEYPRGARSIAAALCHNRNIQRLELTFLNEMCLLPILKCLVFNTSVKELELGFGGNPSHNVAHALKNLLESTGTIRQFELTLTRVQAEAGTFHQIAQGIIQSTSVTDVKLEGCWFCNQEVVLLLNNILKSKSNLQSLNLKDCFVDVHGEESFRTAILSLLQPDSSLRSLALHSDCNLLTGAAFSFGFQPYKEFCRFLTAVETSPLERLSIGTIDSREKCLALNASIPKMQVETLELSLQHYLQDLKVDFIQAIKQNASLQTVVVTDGKSREWLNEEERMQLNSYTSRNEFLAEWIENPASVPRATWPEYLAVTQTTGPDTVFCILQALTNVPVSWFEVDINIESAAVPIHRHNDQPSAMVLFRKQRFEI